MCGSARWDVVFLNPDAGDWGKGRPGNASMAGNGTINKILIVDDEPPIADTLALILRSRGYEVKAVYSAEEAIETIAVWAPQLAIVDVMLPLMNGIDLSIVLKANHAGCEILLFSGQPDTGPLLEEALRKGHRFEVLTKPLHPGFLLERVQMLLGTWREPFTDA
jgi:DNA-binding response OmpR family regulator